MQNTIRLLPQVVHSAEDIERLMSLDSDSNPFISLTELQSRQHSQIFEGAQLVAVMSCQDQETIRHPSFEFHYITKITQKSKQIYLEIPKVDAHNLYLPSRSTCCKFTYRTILLSHTS